MLALVNNRGKRRTHKFTHNLQHANRSGSAEVVCDRSHVRNDSSTTAKNLAKESELFPEHSLHEEWT